MSSVLRFAWRRVAVRPAHSNQGLHLAAAATVHQNAAAPACITWRVRSTASSTGLR